MIVNAFNDVPDNPLLPSGDLHGKDYLDNISAIQVGFGSRAFKSDESGIWLGANAFADAPFSVNMAGDFIATSATISGAITASTIDIGGADATSFHVDVNGNIWSGHANFASAPFKVSNAGVLTASGATITGAISGSTIDIGGADATSFHVDINGNSWSGHANFASAPFRVSSGGAVTASSLTLTNASVGTGSSYTGSAIAATYIGNLNASKITAGDIASARIETNVLGAIQGKISNLSSIKADIGSITSGTITGTTIQTSSSGQRVILDSNNQVRLYTASAGPGVMYGDDDSIIFLTDAVGLVGDLVSTDLLLGSGGSEGSIYNIDWLYGENDLNLKVTGENKMFFDSTTNDSGDDDLSFYPHWGDFYATGTKHFRIKHPDHPDDGWINYVSVESPEVALKIRGIAKLKNGKAIVKLPRHWKLVTEDVLTTLQLTPLEDCNGLFAPKASIKNISFKIKELRGGTSNSEFMWELTAVREGYANFNPEPTVEGETEKHARALVDSPVETETKKQFMARQQKKTNRRTFFRDSVHRRYKEIVGKKYVDKAKVWQLEDQHSRAKFNKVYNIESKRKI